MRLKWQTLLHITPYKQLYILVLHCGAVSSIDEPYMSLYRGSILMKS